MNYDVCIYVSEWRGGGVKGFMFLAVLVLTQLLLLWEESEPSLPFTYLHLRTDSCCPLTQRKGISTSTACSLGVPPSSSSLSPLPPQQGRSGNPGRLPGTWSLLLPPREDPVTAWASTSPSRNSWFMFLGSTLGCCFFPHRLATATGIVKAAMDVLEWAGEVINNSASCFPQGTEH